MNQNSENQKSPQALREEEILKYWEENSIFEKTLSKEAPMGDLVFYDGPPFATGLPHYGHILGGTGKDVFARYKTMRGFRVARRWGWDTHGLPIETIVEKSLGITSKKQIEEMGLDVFAREARSKVLGFVADWKKTVDRTGRWVDFDGSYKTMDTTFIESVWWALGQLNDKKLIYEADRVLPYCPRCQTPLANAEIAMDNSYKDIVDISVYVKIALKDHKDIYVIVWTTTPWSLPGDTALAVNAELTYVKVSFENGLYYVGKDRFESVFKDKDAKIVEEIKGDALVGLSYIPPFDYFAHSEVAQSEMIWKIYAGDFVTAETGTGIVHIAPSFGEDDANLAKKYSIPTIKHVLPDGTFVPEVTHFAGVQVKPKENHQATDVEIIKYLAHNHLLFAKEKLTHSYPHCYRCETPLLYYGLPSWFIRVQEFKQRILELNQGIAWTPEHLRDGRFKHIVENAPDWNFSRNRFWASPLPIWKSESGRKKFISSIEDLKKHTKKSGNKYFVMRHGEAGSNTTHTFDFKGDPENCLTEEGKRQVLASAEQLKNKKIDIIVHSPMLRTTETAKLVAEAIGFSGDLATDDRLREIQPGSSWQGKKIHDFLEQYSHYPERFTKENPDGESYRDVKKRVMDTLYDLEKKYTGKNILIVSHGSPVLNLILGSQGLHEQETPDTIEQVAYPKNAELRELDFVPLPHNENYELDLHRPYIDAITLEIDGEEYSRIPEVIDCWFESGSMPFAQDHFPFEKPDWKETSFPSDFVVEYIAQTRTWFYYTLLLSTMLFDASPFKHIVTTGNLNGDDGQKMSKSKGNYPDPLLLIDKYGVDALRMYLMSSVLMKGEDSNFMEKTVDEIYKKTILRLNNCLSFIDMYQVPKMVWEKDETSSNVLDQWIMARLAQVVSETTIGFESYNTVEATKGINLFVDDLSAWYLRRSRDRFKSNDFADRDAAGKTLVTVLIEFAKIVAPVMPFIAETIYQKLGTVESEKSVHLEVWGTFPLANEWTLEYMEWTRELVRLGLEQRSKTNIKVRQPLQKLMVANDGFKGKNHVVIENKEYADIVKDELNVKEIVINETLPAGEVLLDTTMTPELQREGYARELMRALQDMRKKAGLNPTDVITLAIETNDAGRSVIESFQSEIQKVVNVSTLSFESNDGEEIRVDDLVFKVKI